MKWILKLWNLIVDILLLAALVLAFSFVGTRFFGYTPFIVTSGSMQSIYPVNSIIYVKEVSPEEVEVGDAITFHLGGDTIATHQVWQINEDERTFRTQGVDNKDAEGNIQQDAAPVPFDDLIGVPTLCVPKLGVVYEVLKQPLGLCIVVFIVALIALVSVLTAPAAGGKAGCGARKGRHEPKRLLRQDAAAQNTGIPSTDEQMKKENDKEKGK